MILQYCVLAFCDIGAKLLGFTVTVAILRRFGTTGLGQISLAQSIVTYGLMLATCGMDLYAVKNVSTFRGGIQTVAGTIIALRSLFGLLVLGCLLGLTAFIPHLHDIRIFVTLFGLTLLTGAISVIWVAQATHRSHIYGLAGLVTQGIYLSLVLVGIGHNLGAWTVPLALVVAELIVGAGLLIWMGLTFGPPRRAMQRSESIAFLRESLPIGGSTLLRAVALGSDIVLVGFILTMEDVGVYAGVFKLFTFGMSLVVVYCVVLLPRLSERNAQSISAVQNELRASLYRTLPAAILAVGVGCAVAAPVLGLLYTPSFAQAAPVLIILLVTLGFYVVSAHMRTTLLALGYQRRDLLNVSVASVIHVGAKLILIPVVGIAGAALGTLLGEFTLTILGVLAVRFVLRQRTSLPERLSEPMISARRENSTATGGPNAVIEA